MDKEITNYLDNIKKHVMCQLTNEESISFSEINKFPGCCGVYFIYDEDDELVYIGAGLNIKDRCSQYINRSAGGTFRFNLIQNKELPNGTIKEIKANKQLNDKWIKKIKEEYKAKIIKVNGEERDIAYEEAVYIVAFKPLCNKFSLSTKKNRHLD